VGEQALGGGGNAGAWAANGQQHRGLAVIAARNSVSACFIAYCLRASLGA